MIGRLTVDAKERLIGPVREIDKLDIVEAEVREQ